MMNVISVGVSFVVLALLVAAGALIFVVARRGNMVFDARQTYFYLVAFCALVIAFFSTLTLTGQINAVVLPNTPPSESRWNLNMRQQIANTLGMILVALPVWIFHWRTARRHALALNHLIALRVYLYAITIITLITAVIVGGTAGAGAIKALLGLVDFSNAQTFWRDELTAFANLAITLGVWFYHWRSVEHVPAQNNLEDSHS